MKKILIVLLAVFMVTALASDNLFAAGIGVKGGYSWMQADFADAYKDRWNGGVYFDLGTFLINNMRFRPGLDYLHIDSKGSPSIHVMDLWGIHFDWCWFFMGNHTISPFLGFGPSLNYLNLANNRNADDDSDAGVDLFAGITFGVSGTPIELMVEWRYKFIDIANLGDRIMQVNVGLMYKF